MNLNNGKLFSPAIIFLVATLVIAAATLVSTNVLSGTAITMNQTSSSSSSSSPSVPSSISSNNNRTTTTIVSIANMTLQSARDLYLSVWNRTAFNVSFSTFVVPNSTLGYGVYREHSNVFKPGETIVLYVEPVGFKFKPITDGKGNKLHLINMTANFVLAGSNGTLLQTITNVPVGSIVSHRENTELYLDLTLTQTTPFPVGNYNITYIITDQVSGQSFRIEKQITVAANNNTSAAS